MPTALSKSGLGAIASARLFLKEFRSSLPLISALILFALFDFTQRVLPEKSFDKALKSDLEMPTVTHGGPLTDDYFEYYFQKLGVLSGGPSESEKTLFEDSLEDKIAESPKILDRFELQLLGIFKDDDFFAIIKHFVYDEGGHQLSKVVSGQKLVGLSVKSISQSEVMLVGGEGDIKILRLFDLNLNEKTEGLAP